METAPCAACKAIVARRVEQCSAHERTGHQSTAHLLADIDATSVTRATEVVKTGRRLALHIDTAAAVRARRLLVQQALRRHTGRRGGTGRGSGAARAGAARAATSRDARAELVVHVSLTQLLGCEPSDDDLCMVRGGGPIPLERVREVLRENAFVKGVLHHGTDIVKVEHFGRHRPAELETALEARAVRTDGDVFCSDDRCDQRFGIEWGHIQPLSEQGPTSCENMKPLCRLHHHDKTRRDRQRAGTSGPDPP